MAVELVGLDADDTLWHSEGHYEVTQERYSELLAPWVDEDDISAALLETERRNLKLFGYGAKGFTLSMIETAIALTGGEIDGHRIEQIVTFGKEILTHPVELLDDVADVLDELARAHRLMLMTKGDLFHQESKIAASGLADVFERVEIVAEKDEGTYARVLDSLRVAPLEFCMIGNSVRSDISPVLELGGAGVHVPYRTTWEMEHAEVDEAHPRLRQITSIREAPEAVRILGEPNGVSRP
ncbi:MAG: HAD family hydrolase [Thermoleophilia bacterium]|nr:HAD family hydrolase [Thermoleophilia bacterium]MDH3725444.1 HAD family hydrolase [Thermoleophilia bacterium]